MPRRPSRPGRQAWRFLVLLAAACLVQVLLRGTVLSFSPPPGDALAQRVGRRSLLPFLAAGGAAAQVAPSYAESGVTKAWGKNEFDGSPDDVHLGGVKWTDKLVGTGASPELGQYCTISYKLTAVVDGEEVTIEDLFAANKPADFRFGAGQMLAGMDEGVKTMKSGGVRELNIPPNLAFGEAGLPPRPGRPRIPPNTPVKVNVKLEFIAGLDDVYEAPKGVPPGGGALGAETIVGGGSSEPLPKPAASAADDLLKPSAKP